MRKLSGWAVSLICLGYVVVAPVAAVQIITWRAAAGSSARGTDEYFVIVHSHGWWLLLWLGPPCALLALWLWSRRGRSSDHREPAG